MTNAKPIKTTWQLLYQAAVEWTEDRAPAQAAAIAFYTIFSLAPIAVIAVSISGYIYSLYEPQFDATTALVQQVYDIMDWNPEDRSIERLIINSTDATKNLIATVFGLAALLFGATAVFAQVQDSLNLIWGVRKKPGKAVFGFLQTRLLSFLIVLGIGLLLLALMILSAFISSAKPYIEEHILNSSFVIRVIELSFSVTLVTVLFGVLFKFLPDAIIKWRDVWIGALFSSVLFSLGKWMIGIYLGYTTFASTYGAAGSLVIVLLWIYYSALIFLFGAEFTQVYARLHGSAIRPRNNAIVVPKSHELYDLADND